MLPWQGAKEHDTRLDDRSSALAAFSKPPFQGKPSFQGKEHRVLWPWGSSAFL